MTGAYSLFDATKQRTAISLMVVLPIIIVASILFAVIKMEAEINFTAVIAGVAALVGYEVPMYTLIYIVSSVETAI